MALQRGDRLSLTRQVTLWLGQYDSLKPHVTLTRELGDDPKADRDDMERVLYVELRRAILFEIRDRQSLSRHVFDDGRVTPLLKHCEEVIRDGEEGKLARERTSWPGESKGTRSAGGGGSAKGPRRKVASRRRGS